MTIEETLEQDTYLKGLYESSKGKIKSSNFIKLYKSLLALEFTEDNIIEYFSLDTSYNEFIKNYI